MSTKPCPQCGSTVPMQARFCGQCGHTFVVAGEPPARIPTTVDEATADPPPAAEAPPPRPHAGMPTAIGHVAIPVPSPGVSPVGPSGFSPVAAPGLGPVSSGPRGSAPTALGPAVATPPKAIPFGNRTMVDPAPYGSSHDRVPEENTDVNMQQRPTPLVPPPNEPSGDLGEITKRAVLSKTMNDPEVAERARAIRDATLAEHLAKQNPQTPGPKAEEAAPAAPARPAAAFGKTMVLGGIAEAPPAAAPAAEAASPLSKSVLAPSSWAPPPPDAPAPAAPLQPAPIVPVVSAAPAAPLGATMALAGSDKQTMLGMPAVDLPRQQSPAEQPAPQPQAFPPAFKTMMGVAIPGIAPTRDPGTPSGPANRPAGTLMGVAIPGIAPTHSAQGAPQQQQQQHVAPSQPQQHPPAGAQPYHPNYAQSAAPPIVPPPAPLVMEPLPEAPRAKSKKGVPAVAVVGIVFVLVAIIGTGAALLIMKSGAPLTAQPQLDEAGKESLKIRCESCPDGTMITLGASSAKVEGAAALLPLPAPLSIGDNDLSIQIDRPAAGRDETVKVHVPVAYRVKADLATLTAAPPTITVRVEAIPGTEVTVDGKPISLDGAGKGSHTIDVTREVDGPSDDQKTIDKKIPFSIKPKGREAPETGQLAVRAAVVPLHIDAPGLMLYTERTTGNASGQTKPGGTVTIDGQGVTVDAQGRFGVRVELPAEGEKTITIIANAPPLAPRTVRAKLVRVASLEKTAKTLEEKSPLGFDAYGADPASQIGQEVAVDGELIKMSVAQGHSVMLVEEKKTCSASAGACVVRVVHGEEVKASPGDNVRAFGRVEGVVTSSGKNIPDVEGALVLTKPAGKK